MTYATLAAGNTKGFGRGLSAALAAAALGGIGWAVLTGLTNYKIGFAAIGIGLLVGLAVERFGGGDGRLPIVGAIAALLGCLFGDVLADAHILASQFHISIFTVLRDLSHHPRNYVDLYQAGFKAFDLVFYAIAGYEGYKLSLRGVLRARAAAAPVAPLEPAHVHVTYDAPSASPVEPPAPIAPTV
jgi:hypothetical protein